MRTVRSVWTAAACVCAAAALSAQASSQTAAPEPTGIIAGQVVDAESGQPVGDVVVSLAARGQSSDAAAALQERLAALGGGGGLAGLALNGSPPVPRLLTGADGRFVFHGLPKGSYLIAANAAGYLPSRGGQHHPQGDPHPVELDEAGRALSVRIPLWRYAAVAGTVTDDAGEPAVGLQVRALRRTMTAGHPDLESAGSATTDDRGRYRIGMLPPGRYVVTVPQTKTTVPVAFMEGLVRTLTGGGAGAGAGMLDVISSNVRMPASNGLRVGDLLFASGALATPPPAADGRLLSYQTVFYPSTARPDQAESIVLTAGTERPGIDLSLRLVPTAAISGTVIGPDGPAGSLGIQLSAAGGTNDADMAVATTVTSPDGAFTLLGVPPGSYVARATKQPRPEMPAEMASNPMFQMVFGDPSAPRGPTEPLFAESAVSVGGRDVSGLTLVLAPGLTVSGRIEFDGSKLKPPARQLQAMRVTLQPADGRDSPNFARGSTSQTGEFKTPGERPGRYVLVPPAATGWLPRSAMAGGRDLLVDPFELKDADLAGVVLTYTDQVAQISGTVHAGSGGDLQDVTVLLVPADYRLWIANGMNPRRAHRAVPTGAGAYTVGGLIEGDYLIGAVQGFVPGDEQDPRLLDAALGGAVRIHVGAGEHKGQDLQVVTVSR